MPQHIHVHFHEAQSRLPVEVHWHLYPNPGATAKNHDDDDVQHVTIINPPNNQGWNVRPPTPGSPNRGLICADGNAVVGGEPAEAVWAYIFDHLPTTAELATIPTGAVCGQMVGHTGDWIFRHDTLPCLAGPTGITGQLGTEIPGAQHSPVTAGGVPNWLAVWGVKGGMKDVAVHRFKGITSTSTSCGGSAAPTSTGITPIVPMEPHELPPLPSSFLAHFKLSNSKPGTVRLEYSPAASQSHHPIWLSQCARWRLSVEMIEDSLLAQLDGRWTFKDENLHVRWSGILAPEKLKNKLAPMAPVKLLSHGSPVDLEGAQ
jgi:hypothetical protein